MTQAQTFTGSSRDGNLQEALDNAVREAKEGAANPLFFTWELAAVTGEQGGFVGANVVNVSIRVAGDGPREQGEGRGQGQSAAAGAEASEAEVPTTRNGLVARLPDGPDICMDGATFELQEITPGGPVRLRLRPTNDEAESVLSRLAGTRQDVTVTGYMRRVTCERMDVYHAVPTHGSGS